MSTSPPPERTGLEAAVDWIGFHLFELAGIGTPAVLGVVVNPWLAIGSGLAAAGWAGAEARLTHHRTALPSATSTTRAVLPTQRTTDHDGLGENEDSDHSEPARTAEKGQ